LTAKWYDRTSSYDSYGSGRRQGKTGQTEAEIDTTTAKIDADAQSTIFAAGDEAKAVVELLKYNLRPEDKAVPTKWNAKWYEEHVVQQRQRRTRLGGSERIDCNQPRCECGLHK
jgi:hypothetical protein